METTASFGYWIRRQRKALDLTQQGLAERVGCSVAAIKKIESDERRPSRQIAERLADILGVPAGQREMFLEVARGLRPVDQLSLAREAAGTTPAPLDTRKPFLHNLPIQLTSFVGREREMTEAKQLLANARLLTLIGPGGTGKTRLALQIAQEVLPVFTHGVWLVELAPLTDPSLIPQTVASVFELREAPNTPLTDILTNYLRAKQLLLILDNCEHLIAACAKLSADLLQVCPQLTIIASSREALGVSGETVYRVPSLSLPDPAQVTREALLESEAGRLFVERARAVQSHFALQDSNASAATQICHRLDGIPLALELAAARVAVFSTEEIATRLDDRFRLLTGGSRTALERHQTLRALIDWSHDLLSDEERRLFRQLSVFAGGWTFEAAEVVCSAPLSQPGRGVGGEGLDVLNLLTQLVNKSLVMVDAGARTEGTRYRLPETIRQYARDKLLDAGEAEQVRDRHLAFFLQFAETAEPKLRGSEQLEWLERVETDHDNLRTALSWSLESGKSERALELAGALGYFWELRGYWSEGRKWLDDALALAEREQSGRVAAGEIYGPSRAEMAQRAKVLYAAGRIRFLSLFDPHTSRTIVAESLRLWRELGDKWWMAVALEHVGFMFAAEDVQMARAHLEEGVSLARQVEDRWPLAMCLIRLAGALRTDNATARRIREEGVAVARSVGDKSVLSQGVIGLVTDNLLEGNLTAAAPLAEEALAEARAIGSATHILLSLLQLVLIKCYQGDPAEAKRYCFEMLAFVRETGNSQWLLLVLLAFGEVASFGGQPQRGARLLVTAVALLRKRGIKISDEAERDVMVLRQAVERAQQLDPAAFEAAWAEGQQMTMEQALALATENEGEDSQPPKNDG
jgi:predicted ATPase/DNA-binding XRE family transcriptional regulator